MGKLFPHTCPACDFFKWVASLFPVVLPEGIFNAFFGLISIPAFVGTKDFEGDFASGSTIQLLKDFQEL